LRKDQDGTTRLWRPEITHLGDAQANGHAHDEPYRLVLVS
jgi:hypothetical protein